MNRETLRTQGLTEEQIDVIMAEHGRSMQQVQSRLTAAETRNTDLETQLEQASNSGEIQTLTERAEQAESQVTDLQGQLSQIDIDNQVNTALTEAGATDLEYARFKLGQVEVNEDGAIKDLDNKIKELQTNLPDYFEKQQEQQQEQNPLDGFKRIGNDLSEGQASKPISMDRIEQMTPQEINENWEAVSASLENGGN